MSSASGSHHAGEFAARHRERAGILERKVGVIKEELAYAEREYASLAAQYQGEARDRPQRHQRHGLGLGGEQLLQRLGEVEHAPRARHRGVAEPRVAVGVARGDERALERPPGADGERPALSRAPEDLHGVAPRVLDDRVAVRDRNPPHVQLRRLERQKQGETVVDAGVGIDDDGMGDGG